MKLTLGVLVLTAATFAQPPRPAAPPKSPKDGAPADFTGYWVSIVTEDWRWRMVTPLKGDSASVPVNAAARKVIDAWDPAKDEAAGQQCKAYGAPAVMRIPGRVHITWQDDNTLKVETDEGTQTRLFHFGAMQAAGYVPPLKASRQGFSFAEWDVSHPTFMGFAPPPPPAGGKLPGSLKVTTTKLLPGYLRKNGIPYGTDATLTEYFTRTHEANGDSWLLLTSIVEDPQYLASDFLTSDHYKREADGSKWNPTPCQAR